MKSSLIGTLLTALIKLLPDDIVVTWLREAARKLEEKIVASENKVDDVILPLLRALISALED